MLESNFSGIRFSKKLESVRAVHKADRTEVVFPPNFPCAPLGGKTTGYVEFRAVLQDLVCKHMYTWSDHLSQAQNEDKTASKIVNMHKTFVSPDSGDFPQYQGIIRHQEAARN
jgi:hypothetical protein